MKIAITGGAGYVGSALVPKLLKLGHEVTVLDLFWYGQEVFNKIDEEERSRLRLIKGDIRDGKALREAFVGQDAVIHLACISNDPSYELSPALGKSINYDCFQEILATIRTCGIRRFIYASSSSVYGIQDVKNVTEGTDTVPLTDYSRFKLACERELQRFDLPETKWTIIRPATVCGYAPRLRLDLTVNILTTQALTKKIIIVHGGRQLRPNIHVEDMARSYVHLLGCPESSHRRIYNCGFENHSVIDIAYMVNERMGEDCKIIIEPTKDHRSYHINSLKIGAETGFRPMFNIADAIESLRLAYNQGLIENPLLNPLYYNIKRMHQLDLGSAG